METGAGSNDSADPLNIQKAHCKSYYDNIIQMLTDIVEKKRKNSNFQRQAAGSDQHDIRNKYRTVNIKYNKAGYVMDTSRTNIKYIHVQKPSTRLSRLSDRSLAISEMKIIKSELETRISGGGRKCDCPADMPCIHNNSQPASKQKREFFRTATNTMPTETQYGTYYPAESYSHSCYQNELQKRWHNFGQWSGNRTNPYRVDADFHWFRGREVNKDDENYLRQRQPHETELGRQPEYLRNSYDANAPNQHDHPHVYSRRPQILVHSNMPKQPDRPKTQRSHTSYSREPIARHVHMHPEPGAIAEKSVHTTLATQTESNDSKCEDKQEVPEKLALEDLPKPLVKECACQQSEHQLRRSERKSRKLVCRSYKPSPEPQKLPECQPLANKDLQQLLEALESQSLEDKSKAHKSGGMIDPKPKSHGFSSSDSESCSDCTLIPQLVEQVKKLQLKIDNQEVHIEHLKEINTNIKELRTLIECLTLQGEAESSKSKIEVKAQTEIKPETTKVIAKTTLTAKTSSQCQFCRDLDLPVHAADLHCQVLKLLGPRKFSEAVLTILLRPDNIYHVNVRELSTGKVLGCVLVSDAAIEEALVLGLFQQVLTFCVIDSRSTLKPPDQAFGYAFELIRDQRQSGGKIPSENRLTPKTMQCFDEEFASKILGLPMDSFGTLFSLTDLLELAKLKENSKNKSAQHLKLSAYQNWSRKNKRVPKGNKPSSSADSISLARTNSSASQL